MTHCLRVLCFAHSLASTHLSISSSMPLHDLLIALSVGWWLAAAIRVTREREGGSIDEARGERIRFGIT